MPAFNLRSLDRVSIGAEERRDSGVVRITDRAGLAGAALEEADALLARGLLEQAGERYQAAARGFDDIADAAGGARALLGLGRVLLGLEDPVCREVLEDAGTWLEDLGDEAQVHEVDRLLRIADRSIDESPKSFHAVALNPYVRISSAPPPPSR